MLVGASSWAAAWAQQAPGMRPPPPTFQNPVSGGNLRPGASLVEFFSSRTPLEFWLTCIIAVYGLIVLFMLLWALRGVQDRRADEVSRSVIVVTVIFGALILVTAGFTNEQTAPVFGLFGTIVGYILGRMSRRDDSSERPPEGPGQQ